ncbi:GNAT family N-acetyltransferase [Bacillus sp. FJAT-52991]|uniref:GNAT family N-acetyltransferase n=1 Tax=Bacillus kandeliae TaxID=3129297 RepID=A0ABZ2N8N1_9BACI
MLVKVITATTQQERNDAFDIRKLVFVEEQNVPLELEIDEYEDSSTHFVLYNEGQPCGAGRFRTKDGLGKAERICVLATVRGKGAGQLIMNALEDVAKEQHLPGVILSAQTQAIPFYEKLGYEIISEEYMDAGIPHKTMKKIF